MISKHVFTFFFLSAAMTVVSARGGGRPSSAENPCRQDRLQCLELETDEEKKACMQELPNRPECPNREELRKCRQLGSDEEKKACLKELDLEGGRPSGGRPGGGRPEGGRPEGGRPGDGRPEGGRRPAGGPAWMTDEIKAEVRECFEFNSRGEIKACVSDIMEEYKEKEDNDGEEGDAESGEGVRSLVAENTIGNLRGKN